MYSKTDSIKTDKTNKNYIDIVLVILSIYNINK